MLRVSESTKIEKQCNLLGKRFTVTVTLVDKQTRNGAVIVKKLMQ